MTRFDGKRLTIDLTPDQAASILTVIGAVGELDAAFEGGIGLDYDYKNLEAIQMAILTAVPCETLAQAVEDRHKDHPGDDLVGIYNRFLTNVVLLKRDLGLYDESPATPSLLN